MKNTLKVTFITFLVIFIQSAFISCNTTKSDTYTNEKSSHFGAIDGDEEINEGPVPPVNQGTLLVYYVEKGDTLSKISKKIYGTSSRWSDLGKRNRIIDVNKIYAGDIIYYELDETSKDFAYENESIPKEFIEIKKGDSLSSISKALYGDTHHWRELWKENQWIDNPHKLVSGHQIVFKKRSLSITQRDPVKSIVTTIQPAIQPDIKTTTHTHIETKPMIKTTASAAKTFDEELIISAQTKVDLSERFLNQLELGEKKSPKIKDVIVSAEEKSVSPKRLLEFDLSDDSNY